MNELINRVASTLTVEAAFNRKMQLLDEQMYRRNWNDFSDDERLFVSHAKGGNWTPKMDSDGNIIDRADLTHTLAGASWLRSNRDKNHPAGSQEGAESARAAWIAAINGLPSHMQSSDRNENAAQGPSIDNLRKWRQGQSKSASDIDTEIGYDYKAHANWAKALGQLGK